MPREKINDGADDTWYAEVSWRRKPETAADAADRGDAPGHVQIATVNLRSPFEFPDRESGGMWEAGERFDGWHVSLDEAGVDHLIKTLHKAKRQAFGEPATSPTLTVNITAPAGATPEHVAQAVSDHLAHHPRGEIEEPADLAWLT